MTYQCSTAKLRYLRMIMGLVITLTVHTLTLQNMLATNESA